MTHNDILFISSDSKFDFDSFFDGYAFFQADLVIGNQGFQNYSKNNNNYQKYEDGNYILIDKINNDSYRLSRDYHGYYPLYYYEKDSYWCVSNSIIYIAEHLRDNGISISFNEANVEIWKCQLSLALQLTSHNTFVNEIKVLPNNKDIIITSSKNSNNKICFKRRLNIFYKKEPYETALSSFIQVWNKRYLTILNDENMALAQDLTGGLDSRVLLTFLINNIEVAKNAELKDKLKVNSNSHQITDYEIASRLSSLFNLKLNKKIAQKHDVDKSSADEAYAVWKYFNVGRYAPIVFTTSDFRDQWLEIGGEGGEDNRPVYAGRFKKHLTFASSLKSYREYFSSSKRYLDWVNQVMKSLSILRLENEKTDISILHYREFRSTHHAIKAPRSRMKIAVLASKYFDRLSSIPSSSSRQVFYDVIHNNCNKLLYIPFDDSYKYMNDKNISMLTNVNADSELQGGQIYRTNEYIKSDLFVDLPIKLHNEPKKNPLNILYNEAIEVLTKEKELVESYFGKDYVYFFSEKIKNINLESSKINLHNHGSFLHALILIGVIAEFNNRM